MPTSTSSLFGDAIDPAMIELLIDEHVARRLPRFARLWGYYRNDMEDLSGGPACQGATGRWYRLAQEQGLPARLTTPRRPGPAGSSTGAGREIVIENDIAWRVHALVDFTFGKGVVLQSAAPDPSRATVIETFLRRVFDLAGGVAFFQDLALLGSVYGYVDVLLRLDEDGGGWSGTGTRTGDPDAAAAAFVLELIEAPRAVPVLSPGDYRRLDGYALHYRQALNRVEPDGLLARLRSRFAGRAATGRRAGVERTEVWTAAGVTRFTGPIGERTTRDTAETTLNRLGRIPVVHIQNLPQPFFYEGLSDVEPLIPLQDELNTRLSDRANRVTFQSFKMYLGKGIEGFTQRPVAPGQMWATDNEGASIQEFGGDAASPSEEAHISGVRDAMDKASSVTGVAAGLLKGKVGNLTSENALRVTLMGLLARTEKKRVTYGAGLAQLCELVLHAADVTGTLPNTPDERRVRFDWPSPLPEDTTRRLRDAQLKLELGVPRKQVLAELGYLETAGES